MDQNRPNETQSGKSCACDVRLMEPFRKEKRSMASPPTSSCCGVASLMTTFDPTFPLLALQQMHFYTAHFKTAVTPPRRSQICLSYCSEASTFTPSPQASPIGMRWENTSLTYSAQITYSSANDILPPTWMDRPTQQGIGWFGST